jgi:hypothetical protein
VWKRCSILHSHPPRDWCIISCGMKKEVSPKSVLAIPCPTCGAEPGEKCELVTGEPRTRPHRDRRLIAKEPDQARAAYIMVNLDQP